MKTEEIAKIFLTAYKDVPRMISSLEKCIDHAIKSGIGCSHIYNGISTDMLYEKIIVFKNRQDILATVREVTKTTLCKMKPQNARILVEKFIKKKTFNEIAIARGVSIRSVFRYVNGALKEFCYYLRVLEYDNDEWFRGEIFLEGIYDMILQDNQENLYASNEMQSKTIHNAEKNKIIYSKINTSIIAQTYTSVYLS